MDATGDPAIQRSSTTVYNLLWYSSNNPRRLAGSEQDAPDCGPLLGFVQAHAYG